MKSQELGDNDFASPHIVLGLLESVERDGARSQRRLASELGVAVGLVNAYLKRCIGKGLVKVQEAPARRYAYYLTPQGFAEKSRLTVDYLAHSLGLFRRARLEFSSAFKDARARGWRRVALAGVSDLAEIAIICSLEGGVGIAAIVDAKATTDVYIGLPVVKTFAELGDVDGVIVTDMRTSQQTFDAAVAHLTGECVLAPPLLGVRVDNGSAGEAP